MAGPTVRGDLTVTRIANVLRLQQGTRNIVAGAVEPDPLTVASEYENIVVDPGMGTPGQTIRMPEVGSGPAQAGIGTEFRITNNATSDVSIALASGSTTNLSGTKTVGSSKTSIIFCTSLTSESMTSNGTWKIVELDPDSVSGRTAPSVISFTANLKSGGGANDRWELDGTNDEYFINIPFSTEGTAGTHNKAPNPHAVIFDSTNTVVLIETIVNPNTGTDANRVRIQVNENPNGRFAGRIEVY